MVTYEVYHMPTTTFSYIVLSMNKSFLFHHLFNEDGESLMEFLEGEKLNQMLLKFAPLCFLGIRNLIVSLKHCFDNMCFVYSIFKLKALFNYDYIRDNCFPGQQITQKVYLFKMYVDGIASKFDFI